jgi:hypothetical protein
MAGKATFPKIVTPAGSSIWPRLNEPDTKYNKAGVYEVKLAFDEDTDLTKLRAKVQELIDAKHAAVVKEMTDAGKGGLAKKVTKRDLDDIFKAEEDSESGDPTGRILIKAKMTATGISSKTNKPWSRKPSIFDAKGNQLKNPPKIGSGTTMKLSVELFPYFAANDKEVGVSFRLEAVQIINLVQFGERDAQGFGFGEEDGDDLSSSAEQEFGAGSDDTSGGGEDDEL